MFKTTCCRIISGLGDILTLAIGAPIAGISALIQPDFDPDITQIKTDKPLVILIHGSGSNKHQWRALSYMINNDEQCCSAVTLNLDGLFMLDSGKNMKDYANAVTARILEMGCQNVILVGHSYGGIVAAEVAESLDTRKLGINVIKVVTISTPLDTPPALAALTSIKSKFGELPIREQEMLNMNNTLDMIKGNICTSHIPYVHICPMGDWAVPPEYATATPTKLEYKEKKTRAELLSSEMIFTGHYSSMLSPSVCDLIKAEITQIS